MTAFMNLMRGIFSGGKMVNGKIVSSDSSTMAILKDDICQPVLDEIPLESLGGNAPDIDEHFDIGASVKFNLQKFLYIIMACDAQGEEFITIQTNQKANYPIRVEMEHITFYLAPLAPNKMGGSKDATKPAEFTASGS